MIYDISSYIIHYLLPYIYHPFPPPGNGCALQYETITWLVGEAEVGTPSTVATVDVASGPLGRLWSLNEIGFTLWIYH